MESHFLAVIDWVHVVLKGVRERTDKCSNEGKKSGPKRRSHDGNPYAVNGSLYTGNLVSKTRMLWAAADVGNS